MKAASPPAFWASAMICRARVVLPLDSGPKISTMRPRGTPPTPSARSRASAPVGIVATFWVSSSPMSMIEPFTNCRSIWETAASMALLLSNAPSKRDHPYGLINVSLMYLSASTATNYTAGVVGSQGRALAFFGLLLGGRLEGEVAGDDLSVLAELAEVLAVDLDIDGAGVAGPDTYGFLRLEGLRETGLGDLLVGQLPVSHDAQPGRVALHAHHDRERIRLRFGLGLGWRTVLVRGVGCCLVRLIRLIRVIRVIRVIRLRVIGGVLP